MNNRTILFGLGALLIAGGIGAYLLGSTQRAASSSPRAAASTSSGEQAAPADMTADEPQAPQIVQEGTAAPPPPGTAITVDPSGTSISAADIAKSAPPPDGFIEYRNDKYGFSFYHSPEGRITEYNEGGGAETVVYENFNKMRGFQIFIVPYTESKISEARFREDVPSGVRENVENTSLDGVQAVTFNSQDDFLGPTREIWIIHNGYLYEITTFKGVGLWFTPIIQSWKWL